MPPSRPRPVPQAAHVEPVSVREATTADHDPIRRLLRAAYQEYDSVLPAVLFGPYVDDVADVEARARTGRLLVAERAGRIVGVVTFYDEARAEGFAWPAGWAGLRGLAVDPAARGLGIGRVLMEACLDRARAGGAPVLCLHTAAFMTAAVAMYEGMGFTRIPEHDFEASDFLGFDPGQRVVVTAYRLDL